MDVSFRNSLYDSFIFLSKKNLMCLSMLDKEKIIRQISTYLYRLSLFDKNYSLLKVKQSTNTIKSWFSYYLDL